MNIAARIARLRHADGRWHPSQGTPPPHNAEQDWRELRRWVMAQQGAALDPGRVLARMDYLASRPVAR